MNTNDKSNTTSERAINAGSDRGTMQYSESSNKRSGSEPIKELSLGGASAGFLTGNALLTFMDQTYAANNWNRRYQEKVRKNSEGFSGVTSSERKKQKRRRRKFYLLKQKEKEELKYITRKRR